MAYRKIFKILGVPELSNVTLEPERGLDMIDGEPEKKRLALMGASTGTFRFFYFVFFSHHNLFKILSSYYWMKNINTFFGTMVKLHLMFHKYHNIWNFETNTA